MAEILLERRRKISNNALLVEKNNAPLVRENYAVDRGSPSMVNRGPFSFCCEHQVRVGESGASSINYVEVEWVILIS